MKDLLKQIISSIEAVDEENLLMGVYGGKLGYSMLYLLSNFTSNDDSVPPIIIQHLNHALNKYRSWPMGLLYGHMGALWGIKHLCDKGIIEEPKSIENMAYEIIRYNFLNLYIPSTGYNIENEIYPFGIVMLPFWDGSNSIFRYDWEEKIILHIHECEDILLGDIHYAYLQKHLSAAHLHSILYFALQTRKKRISTFKSTQIITLIKNLRTTTQSLKNADEYILDFLLNISPQTDIAKMTIDEQLDFIGYLGIFSLFYNLPQLFIDTFNKCKEVNVNFIKVLHDKCNANSLSVKTLMGIGFGLLNLLNDTSNEC